MKKILTSSYEGGLIFVEAPIEASKEQIYQAVRSYVQEQTSHPITSLSNYVYTPESVWRRERFEDIHKGQGYLWEDIPVIKI